MAMNNRKQPQSAGFKTIEKIYRIDRREISYLKFIIEAYDNMATITTLDPKQGFIQINIAPGFEDDFYAILNDLKQVVFIRETNLSVVDFNKKGITNI